MAKLALEIELYNEIIKARGILCDGNPTKAAYFMERNLKKFAIPKYYLPHEDLSNSGLRLLDFYNPLLNLSNCITQQIKYITAYLLELSNYLPKKTLK